MRRLYYNIEQSGIKNFNFISSSEERVQTSEFAQRPSEDEL